MPYLAFADRQNSSHHHAFNTTCRTLHPLIDRTPVTTKRSTQRALPCIQQSTDPSHHRQSVRSIVLTLASTDHQNPIIDQPIAQTPRSVLYPLTDITQATNRLFHASCRTSIRTSSSCNIDMVLLVEAQFGSTIIDDVVVAEQQLYQHKLNHVSLL